jgi:hypothetical protein
VRKPKNKERGQPNFNKEHRTVSPSPSMYSVSGKRPAEALKRVESTLSQVERFEDTILYGPDNAFPLRIAQAVEESPAASSCISTIAQFIKGSGFSDEALMKMPVDMNGTTLWDLHCNLADSLALFWGFAVNFKFDQAGRILNTYQLSFESCRFVEPGETSPHINLIKYNPYFGTSEYKKEFTKTYPVFNPIEAKKAIAQLKPEEKKSYGGQVYYYGKTTPLSRFYPKPSYWSAQKWLEIDARIQHFHAENLDNGFFQSVLMTVFGDPHKMSNNPRTQAEEIKTDGTKIRVATKTVGEEFNENMANNFSGFSKAGNVMVQWALNDSQVPRVEPFQSNTNADLFIALQDLTTKNITIATKVPSILANISEGVSLGSAGSEIQKAIELMQSNTAEQRKILENFYNSVLIPNLQKRPEGEEVKVEIQNFNPVTQKVEVNKEVWAFLNEQEKVAFIEKNMPEYEIIRTLAPTPTTTPAPTTTTEGQPVEGEALPATPAAPAPNSALKDLKISDLNKIQKIVARYNLSLTDPNNAKALTYEQAKQMLSSFGFTEEEINAWLVKPEEI